jgi:hypothetical protein
MPILAGLIGSLFSAFGAFFVTILAGKLAIRVAGATLIAAMGVALIVVFNAWIAPLVQQAFSTSYGQVIGLAFPPVAGSVLSLYFLAWTAVLTYKLQAQAIALTSKA